MILKVMWISVWLSQHIFSSAKFHKISALRGGIVLSKQVSDIITLNSTSTLVCATTFCFLLFQPIVLSSIETEYFCETCVYTNQ